MTEPREVTVKDEEVDAFIEPWRDVITRNGSLELWREKYRMAVQVIIARRVPDAKAFGDDNRDEAHDAWVQAHNACRDKVLKGV